MECDSGGSRFSRMLVSMYQRTWHHITGKSLVGCCCFVMLDEGGNWS